MLRNRGGIDQYADRPVCRAGRASGAHLWSPHRRSRADRLEATLAFIQRRSEMKALWCGATALTLVAAVSLSPAMAQGPKPSGGNTWPGISQRVVPSSTAEECGFGRLWVSPGYASGGKWPFLNSTRILLTARCITPGILSTSLSQVMAFSPSKPLMAFVTRAKELSACRLLTLL